MNDCLQDAHIIHNHGQGRGYGKCCGIKKSIIIIMKLPENGKVLEWFKDKNARQLFTLPAQLSRLLDYIDIPV